MSYNLRRILAGLQEDQQTHDKGWHPDIFFLPLLDKIKHFCLHLTKYLAVFLDPESSEASIRKALIDSFLICLASANTLDMDLGGRVAKVLKTHRELDGTPVVDSFLELRTHPASCSGRPSTFQVRFARAVGTLAKACEASDHLENYPVRTTMEDSVMEIFWALVREEKHWGLELHFCAKIQWERIAARKLNTT